MGLGHNAKTSSFGAGEGSSKLWVGVFQVFFFTEFKTLQAPPPPGVQQLLPVMYKERIATFGALLYSLMKERTIKRIIVGDETAVRVEDLPNTTMEVRGRAHVPIRFSGKERQAFTVWLSAAMELNGDTWV